MRIQFELDQAIAVLNRLEGKASNVNDIPLFTAASVILKEAISKELDSNSARIDKVISTMKTSGYDERVVSDLKATQDRMKLEDAGRKEQYKSENPKKK